MDNNINEKLLHVRARILTERFAYSIYLQVKEVAALPRNEVQNILEIGPGGGYFKMIMVSLGYTVKTLDVQPEFKPDYVSDIRSFFPEKISFDVVCAFEILEHIPYSDFKINIKKISELTDRYAVFSFPFQCSQFFFSFQIPRISKRLRKMSKWFDRLFRRREISLIFRNPFEPDIKLGKYNDRLDDSNPHYWEIGRKSFPEKRIISDIESCDLKVTKKYHSKNYPYHYFVICEKLNKQSSLKT